MSLHLHCCPLSLKSHPLPTGFLPLRQSASTVAPLQSVLKVAVRVILLKGKLYHITSLFEILQ